MPVDTEQVPATQNVVGRITGFLSEKRSSALEHGPTALLVIVVLALYAPVAGFDFINWDDPWYVQNNELLTSWRPSNLIRIATEPVSRNFAPLTILSFLIDHSIWGQHPGGYHVTNLLLHTFNSVLVYLLVRQLSANRFVGYATAAMFAVHPVQIETVAWISSRKGLLSAAFILGALLCWMRPKPTGKQEGLGLLLFAGALLCKAIAVVIPPIILLWDVLVRRRPVADAIVRQVVPGILSVLLLLTTMNAQFTIVGGTREHFELGKAGLIALDSVIVWQYLGMLAWPTNLCVMYDVPLHGQNLVIAASIVAWMLTGACVWRRREQCPWLAFCVASFFLLLLPVLNLFPLTTLMNDRYLYLPSIPVFALVATCVRNLFVRCVARYGFAGRSDDSTRRIDRRGASLRRPLWSAAVAALGIAAVTAFYARATCEHLPVWRSSTALWQHAMTQSPDLPIVRIQWGCTLHDIGRRDEAIRFMDRTLRHPRLDALDRERMSLAVEEWKLELHAQRNAERIVVSEPADHQRVRVRH